MATAAADSVGEQVREAETFVATFAGRRTSVDDLLYLWGARRLGVLRFRAAAEAETHVRPITNRGTK